MCADSDFSCAIVFNPLEVQRESDDANRTVNMQEEQILEHRMALREADARYQEQQVPEIEQWSWSHGDWRGRLTSLLASDLYTRDGIEIANHCPTSAPFAPDGVRRCADAAGKRAGRDPSDIGRATHIRLRPEADGVPWPDHK